MDSIVIEASIFAVTLMGLIVSLYKITPWVFERLYPEAPEDWVIKYRKITTWTQKATNRNFTVILVAEENVRTGKRRVKTVGRNIPEETLETAPVYVAFQAWSQHVIDSLDEFESTLKEFDRALK
jgi:hypothetical protein